MDFKGFILLNQVALSPLPSLTDRPVPAPPEAPDCSVTCDSPLSPHTHPCHLVRVVRYIKRVYWGSTISKHESCLRVARSPSHTRLLSRRTAAGHPRRTRKGREREKQRTPLFPLETQITLESIMKSVAIGY